MSGLLGLSSFPGAGRQLAHAVDRPLAQLGKHVAKVGAEIDVEPAAGFYDRSNRGDLRPGLWAADMQPVFATQDQRPNATLAPVMPLPILCRVAA